MGADVVYDECVAEPLRVRPDFVTKL